MFSRQVTSFLRSTNVSVVARRPATMETGMIVHKNSTDTEVRFENFLTRTDIDGWEIRKALCELHGMDLVPSPPVIIAALRACRRNNDYALAVRMLEAVKFKCGPKVKVIWPYICQEITPTLRELGVDLPEELGYHKPELAKRDNAHVW